MKRAAGCRFRRRLGGARPRAGGVFGEGANRRAEAHSLEGELVRTGGLNGRNAEYIVEVVDVAKR